MRKDIAIALRVTAVTLVLTGLVYPLVTTGLARLIFPWRSAGSFVKDEHGHLVGSELIGQGFQKPDYFHPRPSAAGKDGWDASNSSGTNLGPTSKKLRETTSATLKKLAEENPEARGPWSSPGRKVRPSCGRTPSTSKKLAVTRRAGT